MENKFTPELIEKAKQARSAEELAELAKENGVDISEDDAREYFEQQSKSGELSDDEIGDVTGGIQGRTGNFNNVHDNLDSCSHFECKYCGNRTDRHMCDNLWIYKCCNTCKYSSWLTHKTRVCNFGSK